MVHCSQIPFVDRDVQNRNSEPEVSFGIRLEHQYLKANAVPRLISDSLAARHIVRVDQSLGPCRWDNCDCDCDCTFTGRGGESDLRLAW